MSIVDTECWQCLRPNGSGYAIKFIGRKGYTLHREIWQELYGKLDRKMDLHHICGNKKCYNPNHLMALSRFAHFFIHNERIRGRLMQTHCLRGHEFTDANTYISKNPGYVGGRNCRKCHAMREANRRNKAMQLVAGEDAASAARPGNRPATPRCISATPPQLTQG